MPQDGPFLPSPFGRSRTVMFRAAGALAIFLASAAAARYWITRNPLLSSADGRAIDSQLRESLGDYELTSWVGPKHVAGLEQELILGTQRLLDDIGETARTALEARIEPSDEQIETEARLRALLEERLARLRAMCPMRFYRTKYITRNENGEKELHDRIVWVYDGKVEVIPEPLRNLFNGHFDE